jgi:hypothetical protein
MPSQQNDLLIFRIFDFLAKWGHQAGKEWFNLMEWLLIISALSFAGGISNKVLSGGPHAGEGTSAEPGPPGKTG